MSRSFERQLALSASRGAPWDVKLPAAAEFTALLGAVLDLRPFPVVLLSPNFKVGFMNRAARSALLADEVTISPQGSLRLAEPGADERLSKTLKALAKGDGLERAPHLFAFELADGTRRVLKIEVLRLPGSRGIEPCNDGVWFEVSVRKSTRCSTIPPSRVSAALGLTAAEANLASALAEGLSLHDYAGRERLKITTVRWHLQNIFNRTGTRSQSGLVSMLVSLFG